LQLFAFQLKYDQNTLKTVGKVDKFNPSTDDAYLIHQGLQMENEMTTAYLQMKLQQLEAVLASVSGGHGTDHLEDGQIQALLNACHGLAVEALGLV
jgi:hypothetical protein